MGSSRGKIWPLPSRSVREDWSAWLPDEKDRLFESIILDLETLYSMLSVALDEAFKLRHQGRLVPAWGQASVTADLFDRLADRVLAVVRPVEDHGRHFGTLPNVAALNPEFFRGETARRVARKSNLLSKVLFSSRSKFFHKLHALTEILDELQVEFGEAAEELAAGAAVHPESRWEQLDMLHFDLNTCLRETMVVLKSFLCALNNDEVQPFGHKLQAAAQLAPRSKRPRVLRGSS